MQRVSAVRRSAFAVIAWMAATAAAAGDRASAQAPEVSDVPAAWTLRVRSTGYRFEAADLDRDLELDRFGLYHQFDASATNVRNGAIDLHASGRFADDAYLAHDVTDRSRLYTAYVRARLGAASLRGGRQFLQDGPFGRTLDGVSVTLAPVRACELLAWGGARAPSDHGYTTRRFADEPWLGARLQLRAAHGTRLGTSFSYRNETGRAPERLAGLEGSFVFLRRLTLSGRAAYDVADEAWDREEARARFQWKRRSPILSLQLVDRRQRSGSSRLFRSFGEAERVRLARAILRYEPVAGFGAEIEGLGTYVDVTTTTHVGWYVLFPIGRVGVARRFGDGGRSDVWTGDLGFSARSWLWIEGGATAETYALLDEIDSDDDERDLVSGYLGARVKLHDGLELFLQAQDRTTPELSKDMRLLAGVDLTAMSGTPRLPSLVRGRWLP